jgi:3-hydroxyacyl-[acyl-carrier-protein] dehydratase
MPGVMILEAMAQAAGVLIISADKGTDHHQNIYYYVGIDDARFKKPVIPGDQLELDVKVERMLRGIGKFSCVARVGTELAAEATILLAMRPAEP